MKGNLAASIAHTVRTHYYRVFDVLKWLLSLATSTSSGYVNESNLYTVTDSMIYWRVQSQPKDEVYFAIS